MQLYDAVTVVHQHSTAEYDAFHVGRLTSSSMHWFTAFASRPWTSAGTADANSGARDRARARRLMLSMAAAIISCVSFLDECVRFVRDSVRPAYCLKRWDVKVRVVRC